MVMIMFNYGMEREGEVGKYRDQWTTAINCSSRKFLASLKLSTAVPGYALWHEKGHGRDRLLLSDGQMHMSLPVHSAGDALTELRRASDTREFLL